MTDPFEAQVAETLFRLMRDWPMSDPYTGPSEQFLNRLAPRVAAAIRTAAIEESEDAGLAALRGTPDP